MIKLLVFSSLTVVAVAVVQWYNRRPGPFRLLAAASVRVIALRLYIQELYRAAYAVRDRWPECIERARRMIP